MSDSSDNGLNLWQASKGTDETRRKSDIACYSCRRRKVKCDRRYPQCSVCEETAQICDYPQGPMKPGPKLGSLKRPRKRPRAQQEQESQNDVSPSPGNLTRPPPEAIAIACGPERPAAVTPSPRRPSVTEERASIQPGERVLTAVENYESEKRLRRGSNPNLHDLSFILHPAHDASSPDQDKQHGPVRSAEQEPGLLQKVCVALGVTRANLGLMVKTYFDNMVAINLFREPYFHDKLTDAVPESHIYALFAAMLAYAVRFCPSEMANECEEETRDGYLQPQNLLPRAFTYIESSLKECGDESPSLCLLQALIIATHCQLTQGVRGKAWRSLGTCIRLAYELNLHLVDSGKIRDLEEDINARQWCYKEEQRRAWWAIWEMDVFASTIRRTPPAIDWSQMETFLPIDDQDWFMGRPQPSCFMERDPIHRWKALHECGNQSPKAWFLVVNSLMKEAQAISTPRSVPQRIPRRVSQKANATEQTALKNTRRLSEEAAQKLETLANSVRCLLLVLPEPLRYRNQYLDFQARAPGQLSSTRQLHCSIYNIYVMSQLAKLMIYRYDVFQSLALNPRHEGSNNGKDSDSATDAEDLALTQYFEAADNILTIVNRSCDDHIRYINPFLPSTIWLASAVQIFRKEFERNETSRTFTKSKFEVLYMTYKQCVSFWNIHTALQQNLEALETQLENYRRFDPEKQADAHAKAGLPMDIHTNISQINSRPERSTMPIGVISSTTDLPPASIPMHTPPSSVKNDERSPYRTQIAPQVSTPATLPASMVPAGASISSPSRLACLPILDYMNLPFFDGPLESTTTTAALNAFKHPEQDYSGFAGGDPSFGQSFDWRNPELSVDVHDLLSGYSAC